MTWCTGLARLCPRGQTARVDSVGKGERDDGTSCPRAATRLCPPYDSTHPTASHDGSRGCGDPLLKLRLGGGADLARGHLAVLENHQGRERHHGVLRCGLGILVDIELDDLHLAG